jgi:hypothetical protein
LIPALFGFIAPLNPGNGLYGAAARQISMITSKLGALDRGIPRKATETHPDAELKSETVVYRPVNSATSVDWGLRWIRWGTDVRRLKL